MAAPCTALRPTPPVPMTTTLLPGFTLAALTTAPNPVMTAQPRSAALSRGKSCGILSRAFSGMTECSENVDAPAKCLISFPSSLNRVVPSMNRPDMRTCVPAAHSAGRPSVQNSHSPHDSRHSGIT
jgi:hypothetical protein